MTVPNPRAPFTYLNQSYIYFSIAHELPYVPKTCMPAYTRPRTHAPQSLKDAITKNGIPGLPGGGGRRQSQGSCTPRYPNRARERLINKQINKSSASLSRGEQVERLQPDGPLVPAAPGLVLNAPRLGSPALTGTAGTRRESGRRVCRLPRAPRSARLYPASLGATFSAGPRRAPSTAEG